MIITFSKSTYSREVAAFLAIILGVATIILLTIFSQVEKKGNYISVSKTKAKLTKQKINNPVLNVIAHIAAWLMFVIYMLPIVLIVIYSFCDYNTIMTGEFTSGSFTLENYQKLFTSLEAVQPYLVSIAYSLGAALPGGSAFHHMRALCAEVEEQAEQAV